MKSIDFENAEMIIRGFISVGCKAYAASKFNKYGMSTFNEKEVKTVHIDIIHPQMSLISYMVVSRITYNKLIKSNLVK